MHFKSKIGIALALSAFSAVSCFAVPVQVQSTVFQAACVSGGCGGGFGGMVGGTQVGSNLVGGQLTTLFCVDFQNDVGVPSVVYQANISTLTSGSDLSNTRYGRPFSQWDDSLDPSLAVNFTTSSFGTLMPSALERYQMMGYLIKQYAGNMASANAIQSAIWQIDAVVAPAGQPTGLGAPPNVAGSGAWLTQAANFILTNSQSSIDSYLSTLRIVTNVAPLYLLGQNPAQEFIADIAPEPAGVVWALAGVAALLIYRRRSVQARSEQV